ncbi:DUF4383 domain-containing protein [Kineococcus radiotolerans]|uniref:DUF4383 domain-containing protein n=1 Tax=Kineococcus radiotolerans (strain ATCC BAA-149 / DSM 14245 / SRS30216) TaxID=266940 RepID=A6W6A0_KINRD|nr:DUF4383 domain-containing protein [Kineococcus radiotolerans]ABS02339.1 hypothetical protein Krad_0851 [Kineococcus radiotolerans SRS30216 = ATCC BAA-149]
MTFDMAGKATRERPRVTAAQYLSLIAGALLVVLGLAGFAVTGFSDWTGGTKEQQVIGFAVNPLSNVLHLVLGALGLLGRTGARRARWYGILLFLVGAALFTYGALSADHDGDPLNLNWPTSTLHAVLAVAGLVMAFVPVKTPPQPTTAELK